VVLKLFSTRPHFVFIKISGPTRTATCQKCLFLLRHYTAYYMIWIINAQTLLKFIAILNIIVGTPRLMLITLFSRLQFSQFQSQTTTFGGFYSWFISTCRQSATTPNPHSTKQDDEKLISFWLAKVLERGHFFSHSSDSHIVVPLNLKRAFL